jgi:hypothetical protein
LQGEGPLCWRARSMTCARRFCGGGWLVMKGNERASYVAMGNEIVGE